MAIQHIQVGTCAHVYIRQIGKMGTFVKGTPSKVDNTVVDYKIQSDHEDNFCLFSVFFLPLCFGHSFVVSYHSAGGRKRGLAKSRLMCVCFSVVIPLLVPFAPRVQT